MLSSDRVPEDVRAILTLLLASMREALGAQLAALYLYGSLASGDFDPASSDADFLAVTQATISAAEFERLRAMHERIAVSGVPFATHLEGSYIPREALRRYDPATAWHPTIGTDWPFKLGFHDSNWIIERAIVRERGVVLYGPPPSTLIDPISPQQLREAACAQMTVGWREMMHDERFLRPRNYAAFAILTFCRALYTIHQGVFCSKPVAAAWARETYPAWQPMIARALAWRPDETECTSAELAETMAFLRDAITAVRERCEQQ